MPVCSPCSASFLNTEIHFKMGRRLTRPLKWRNPSATDHHRDLCPPGPAAAKVPVGELNTDCHHRHRTSSTRRTWMTMMRMKMIAKLPLLSTHQCRAPPFRNVVCRNFTEKGLILFLDAAKRLDAVWQTCLHNLVFRSRIPGIPHQHHHHRNSEFLGVEPHMKFRATHSSAQ